MTTPCFDCLGYFHYSVMDFDHMPGYDKVFEISKRMYYPRHTIWEEIRKCELVCANCHRLRTWQRENGDIELPYMVYIPDSVTYQKLPGK